MKRTYATEEELDQFSRSLNQTFRRFRELFPKGRFILNIWMMGTFNSRPPPLREALGQRLDPGIELFLFPKTSSHLKYKEIIGHPDPDTYQQMAKWLWAYVL